MACLIDPGEEHAGRPIRTILVHGLSCAGAPGRVFAGVFSFIPKIILLWGGDRSGKIDLIPRIQFKDENYNRLSGCQ